AGTLLGSSPAFLMGASWKVCEIMTISTVRCLQRRFTCESEGKNDDAHRFAERSCGSWVSFVRCDECLVTRGGEAWRHVCTHDADASCGRPKDFAGRKVGGVCGVDSRHGRKSRREQHLDCPHGRGRGNAA